MQLSYSNIRNLNKRTLVFDEIKKNNVDEVEFTCELADLTIDPRVEITLLLHFLKELYVTSCVKKLTIKKMNLHNRIYVKEQLAKCLDRFDFFAIEGKLD